MRHQKKTCPLWFFPFFLSPHFSTLFPAGISVSAVDIACIPLALYSLLCIVFSAASPSYLFAWLSVVQIANLGLSPCFSHRLAFFTAESLLDQIQ